MELRLYSSIRLFDLARPTGLIKNFCSPKDEAAGEERSGLKIGEDDEERGKGGSC